MQTRTAISMLNARSTRSKSNYLIHSKTKSTALVGSTTSSTCSSSCIRKLIVGSIISVIFYLALLYPSFSSSTFSFAMSSLTTTTSRPFSLLVSLTFISEEYKEIFLQDIAPLALYVKEHEPGTIAYEVLLNDKDPLKVLIVERYADKEIDFIEIHRTSAPFLEFRPKLQSMIESGYVTMDGQSYYDSGIGFVNK